MKDSDFHQRSFLLGPPPKVIWVKLGTCTTAEITALLRIRAAEIREFYAEPEAAQLVLSVNDGKVRPTDVRDLIGVLSTESGVEIAGFISIQEPSRAMKQAAAKAGIWEYNKGVDYPRVQLLTVKEIVEDKKRFKMPTRIGKKTTGQLRFAV